MSPDPRTCDDYHMKDARYGDTVQPKVQLPPTSLVLHRSDTLFEGGVSSGGIIPRPPSNGRPCRLDPPGHSDQPSASNDDIDSPDRMSNVRATQEQGEKEQRDMDDIINEAKNEINNATVELQDITD